MIIKDLIELCPVEEIVSEIMLMCGVDESEREGISRNHTAFIVRPRVCFHCVVFRVPKNGTLETKKPPAMQVSQHCFSLQ